MPIRYGAPPEEAEQLASAGVEDVARTARMKTSGGASLATTAPEQVSLVAPHEMRTIGLDALVDGRPLAEAPTVGWRYLVDAGAGAVASSEVASDEGGQPTSFALLNEGPYVRSTEASLREVSTLPEVESGDYEVRLLKIPALYVVALWLKDLDGDDDLVVPLDPAPPYVEAGRTYREDEFLAALEAPARDRLGFDDSPQG
jgi:hypothetical protein